MVKYVCDLFLYKGVETIMSNMNNKALVSSGMVLTTSSGSVYTITDRVAKNGRKYQLISGGNLEQDNLVIFPVRGAMIGQPFQCHFMNVESNGAYANQILTTSRIASVRAVQPTNGLSVARPMEQVDMKQPKPRFKGADVSYSQSQVPPRPVKSVSVVHPQSAVQETLRPKLQPVPPERREHMRPDNRPGADTICANMNRIYGQGDASQRIRKEDNRGAAFPGYNSADFPNQEIENTAMQQVVTVNTQNDTYSFRENWDKNGMSYFECRCRKFGDNVYYTQSFNPDRIACGEPLVIRFLNVPENAGYHGRGILTTPVQSMSVKSVPRQFFDTRTLPSIDRSDEEMNRFDEMNHYL